MAQRFLLPQKLSLISAFLSLTINQPASAEYFYGIADADGNVVKQPALGSLQYKSPNTFISSDEQAKVQKIDAGGKQITIVGSRSYPVIASGGVGRQWLSDDLLRFEKNGKSGVCDSAGRVILDPKFSDVGYAGEGIISVTVPQEFNFPVHFYNSEGKYLFKTTHQLYHGQKFSEGLMCLGNWGDRVAYYDTLGREKIVGSLTSGEPFHDGLAAVTIATRELRGAGYIDRDGKFVVGPFEAASVQTFHHGHGIVSLYGYDFGGQSFPRFGIVDRAGKLIVPAVYDSLETFSDSLFLAKKDSRFMLIDIDGKKVTELPANCRKVLSSNSDDHEELIACAFAQPTENAAFYEKNEERLKWGFCDRQGTVRIAPKYDVVEAFEHGLAPVFQYGDHNGRAGLIKTDGSYRLPMVYSGVQRCPDGNYLIHKESGHEQERDASANEKRPEVAFPKALREHNLIGMSKEKLEAILGNGEKSSYKRPGIPDAVKETIQYELYAGGIHCGNASHWLEFGFDSAGKVYGWRNIGFQWEGKWCRENVFFPQNCMRFSLQEAVPKSSGAKAIMEKQSF